MVFVLVRKPGFRTNVRFFFKKSGFPLQIMARFALFPPDAVCCFWLWWNVKSIRSLPFVTGRRANICKMGKIICEMFTSDRLNLSNFVTVDESCSRTAVFFPWEKRCPDGKRSGKEGRDHRVFMNNGLQKGKVMRKDFGAKPLTYPQPVFIIATYDEEGTPDAMNAAWGGISEMNEISLCLSAGHKTVKNLLKRKAFTVSMAEAGKVVACDYVGLVSGNQVPDKFARAGFHAVKSAFVDAPLIEELSVAVECRLIDYNPESCILRGEIVNVSVDERVLDDNGKVDAAKVAPLVFDPFNNDYLVVGAKVGKAFSDGKQLKTQK